MGLTASLPSLPSTVVTRFAPSPTGDLHLGHAYAALFAHRQAIKAGGTYLVRIEDIDHTRCRAEFEARNLEDLTWLGLQPMAPVLRQSTRMPVYAEALQRLQALGLVYPCFCTRAQIRAELAAAAAAPQESRGDTPVASAYPGTCRQLGAVEREARISRGGPFALRLDAAQALRHAGPLFWEEMGRGQQVVTANELTDVVLARKELPTSYHLAVVVDDADQGVTLVTRGEDLQESTPLHRLLYALLGLPIPVWHHHPLCRDDSGRRLAKRDKDLAIRTLRAAGLSAIDVLRRAAAAALQPHRHE